MKRVLSFFLAVVCIMLSSFSAYAASQDSIQMSIVILERNRSTITGQKNAYFTDNNGNNIGKATLTGSFTYNGTTSSCTNASCDVTIYNNSWSTKSVTAYASGNSAVAEVTIVRKLLFITVETKSFSIILTCDRYGNLS